MTKKDSEKDADRPHYYSQFWLDVAAGRRVIGTPRADEGEADESLELMGQHRPVRSTIADTDGYQGAVVHPQVEPEFEEDADEYSTPELETFDDVDEISDEDEGIPVFGANEDDIPDVDITPTQEEEDTLSGEQAIVPVEIVEELEVPEPENEEEEFFEDEEDEEDDDSWTARGRKKPKPGRQVKLPSKTPAKRAKREPRRGF